MAVPAHLTRGLWTFQAIRSLHGRPGLYLGCETVTALDNYLGGYVRGRNDSGYDDDWSVLDAFRSWLIDRGHIEAERVTSAMGFVSCIEALDPSDRNIYTFLRFFREFANELGVEPPL